MDKNNQVNYSRSGLLGNPTASNDSFSQDQKIIHQYKEPLGSTLPPSSLGFRLYIFKDGKEMEMIRLVGSSFFLLGRDPNSCGIKAFHPSISKVHAVIQFRKESTNFDEGLISEIPKEFEIVPFLMDLHSANGTFLNGQSLQADTYYELKSGDVFKLANSSREYVLIQETN